MAFQLKATQQVVAAIGNVTDKRGNPTTVQNPTWTSSDPSVLTVTGAADGMSATAYAAGPVGTASIVLDADADLGDGVTPIQGVAEVEVVAGDAAIVNVMLGTPSEQT